MAIPDAPAPDPGGKLPGCAGMRFLRDSGYSQKLIAVEYGVTEQSVNGKMRRCGLTEPYADYSDLLPWQLRPEHRNQNMYVMLRAAARRKVGGKPMSARRERELDGFLARLSAQDLVVGYGPHRVDGRDDYGFYFAPRRPGVDDWIVRKPQALIDAQ